ATAALALAQTNVMAQNISQENGAAGYLEGKTINVIGDSYVRNHKRPYSESWHSKFAEKYGMRYNNYGRNGGCVAFDRTKDGFGPSMMVRYKDMDNDADIVLLIAGHNDAGMVGNSTDSLAMFRDSLDLLLTELRHKYPKGKIGYVTPWYVDRDGFEPVVRTIKKICKKHRVPVLDNYSKKCVIKLRDEDFRRKYFQGVNDTAHLNAEGHDLFLPVGEKFILDMMR
ncbi:MAG: SGNH/GDSL hydrolase family protein, partial [Bacteroides sp.]|nr:SGNH/GDSL hydrolase family protein [Roseburia sp.]MCM1347708.1 SGNH/GDSL hydrolase family protein [Bacteroides sp.]MCM1422126.1 SGNH/GDSL hydrolase family protein [Bacteroides sp.]